MLGCQRQEASRKIHELEHQATVMLGVHVVKCEPPSPWSPKVSSTGKSSLENSLLLDRERQRYLGINVTCWEWQHLFFCMTIHSHCWVNGRECWDHWLYFVVCFEGEHRVIYLLGSNCILSSSASTSLSLVLNPIDLWSLSLLPVWHSFPSKEDDL